MALHLGNDIKPSVLNLTANVLNSILYHQSIFCHLETLEEFLYF